MKKVTLKDIEWIESPNYTQGRSSGVKAVVIHWYDDPRKEPSIGGVVSYFKNRSAQVSAHFVVSGDRIVQMVNMNDTAWHALHANPYTVGIEVDPRTPGSTYETVGALVKFIRSYYKGIPVKKHSDYVATRCPGTIDVQKIKNIASGKENDMFKGKSAEYWHNQMVKQKSYKETWRKRHGDVKSNLAECKKIKEQVADTLSKVRDERDKLRERNDDLSGALKEANRRLAENNHTVDVGEDTRSWFEKIINLFRR